MPRKKLKRPERENITEKIGMRIREERQRLNLTQEKLVEEVGLSAAYIGQVERGERSLTLENLIVVSRCMSVTVDYLLSDSIVPADDDEYRLWRQTMNNRSPEQKKFAITMVQLIFRFLDDNSHGLS